METWKSLRMMSDKASVFETVSIQIWSLALEFVTLRGQSLSWNWVFLKEPRTPTAKLACVQFQGRPLRALRKLMKQMCIPYQSFFSNSFNSAQSPSSEDVTKSIGRVNSRRTQRLILVSNATPSGLRL